jgi:hypothetical protein
VFGIQIYVIKKKKGIYAGKIIISKIEGKIIVHLGKPKNKAQIQRKTYSLHEI